MLNATYKVTKYNIPLSVFVCVWTNGGHCGPSNHDYNIIYGCGHCSGGHCPLLHRHSPSLPVEVFHWWSTKFPASPPQVKHFHMWQKRSLLSAVMITKCFIGLVSCPQEQTLPNNSSAVVTTTNRLVPSHLPCEEHFVCSCRGVTKDWTHLGVPLNLMHVKFYI